jgi:hypothetical protein
VTPARDTLVLCNHDAGDEEGTNIEIGQGDLAIAQSRAPLGGGRCE